MKALFSKIFRDSSTIIPNNWTGRWVDKNGKSIEIKEEKPKSYLISIRDKDGQFYSIHLLENKEISTENLISRFNTDIEKKPYLEVEAGTYGLGPTFNLYFIAERDRGEFRFAQDSDSIDIVRIRPRVGMGLYDDWDYDLGVPWAYPLEDFKKEK